MKKLLIVMLAIGLLACESADDKADEEMRAEYTGKDNSLGAYIGHETDENGNPIDEENNISNLAADYHSEGGQHTDFREINKYEEVVNNGFGGTTIVARAIIKEDILEGSSSYINKLTITSRPESDSYTYEAKFTPNQELFPNSKTLIAKSGETITFDFGDFIPGAPNTPDNFGLLELYEIVKYDPDLYSYDYFAVLNK